MVAQIENVVPTLDGMVIAMDTITLTKESGSIQIGMKPDPTGRNRTINDSNPFFNRLISTTL